MATFHERFNIIFEKSKLKQEEFGKLFGASKSQVFNWRSGRGEPDTETMKKIALVCNVSLNYLLGFTVENSDSHLDLKEKIKSLPLEKRKTLVKQVIDDFTDS